MHRKRYKKIRKCNKTIKKSDDEYFEEIKRKANQNNEENTERKCIPGRKRKRKIQNERREKSPEIVKEKLCRKVKEKTENANNVH